MKPRTKKKLVIAVFSSVPYWNFPEKQVALLRARFRKRLKVVHVTEREGLLAEITDADWLCASRIDEETFQAARELTWIHCPASGVTPLLLPDVVKSLIVITNSRGENSVCAAEQVLACMLTFTRRLQDAVLFRERKVWASHEIWRSQPPLDELHGKTLGIVGFGSIGRQTARRARAFGMRVAAIKRHPQRGKAFADSVLSPQELPLLLRESDFVVLCLPLTPEIGKLMGPRELKMMKKTAFLINVSRGQVIDEPALIQALRNGQIAGAALDVFEKEPLPPESPLWTLPNVIVTPHYAGSSIHYWDRVTALLAENIQRHLEGRRLLNVVRKKRGY